MSIFLFLTSIAGIAGIIAAAVYFRRHTDETGNALTLLHTGAALAIIGWLGAVYFAGTPTRFMLYYGLVLLVAVAAGYLILLPRIRAYKEGRARYELTQLRDMWRRHGQ